MELDKIVDSGAYPMGSDAFRKTCRQKFDAEGVLVLPGFVSPEAIASLLAEGLANEDKAYFTNDSHTVYLSPVDPEFTENHTRNRQVVSSKGCITDDIIPETSVLKSLYNAEVFRGFLCDILGEDALYEYADPLSSINLHYAKTGQELGWHFDNSSFAITLMVQPADFGGKFEYVGGVRDADAGEMNFGGVADVLDGRTNVQELSVDAGALVLFRGRNAIHRVTPNEGSRTRMLAVLAYNSEPGVALSEEARLTFFGRTG